MDCLTYEVNLKCFLLTIAKIQKNIQHRDLSNLNNRNTLEGMLHLHNERIKRSVNIVSGCSVSNLGLF